jgi:uncharacterized membrane protein
MRVRTCEICGNRVARYVCQECGREVCQFCFEPSTWVCQDCYNSLRRESPVLEVFPWSTPIKLFLWGFVLMFVGIILMVIAAVFFEMPAGTGVLVFIPPLPPIGFGAGPYAFLAMLLVVALAIGLILFVVLKRRAR